MPAARLRSRWPSQSWVIFDFTSRAALTMPLNSDSKFWVDNYMDGHSNDNYMDGHSKRRSFNFLLEFTPDDRVGFLGR